jgi:hypothetical protein
MCLEKIDMYHKKRKINKMQKKLKKINDNYKTIKIFINTYYMFYFYEIYINILYLLNVYL